MATLENYKYATLMQLTNEITDKGNLRKIVEVLNRENAILEDAMFFEADETFSHTVYRRGSLPTPSARVLNDGVALTDSQTTPIRETIMMLHDRSQIDKTILNSSTSPKELRSKRAMPHLEGMSQRMAYYMFYGNAATDPKVFTGLSERLDAANSDNTISSGGTSTGYLTSIYVVSWQEEQCFMIYPRAHKGVGIEHDQFGPIELDGITSGTKFIGYSDHFSWHCGLAVADTRCIGRLANIPTRAAATVGVFDEDDLIELTNNMKLGPQSAIYVPKRIKTIMQIAAKDKTNINYTFDEVLSGKPVMRFNGIPVKLCEAISTAETEIG